jgi:L-fuculose-phosphate aldolase
MTNAQIASLLRELGRLGLTAANAGNVSARRGARMAITATGTRVDAIGANDIVTVDLDGGFEGRVLPSSEWAMHAAVYRAAPEAQVIVHTHSDAAVALSCLEEDLPPFHYMLAEFGGDTVRCAPYATFGTPELAALAAQAIHGRTACLLAHHGMICHGPTARAALTTAVKLETLTRQYLLARAAGPVKLLSPADMDAALRRYATYGQQPGHAE